MRDPFPAYPINKYEISYKFVDELKTTTTVLRGWPACIFCTTSHKYVEEMSTRGITYTPQMEAKKYLDANL